MIEIEALSRAGVIHAFSTQAQGSMGRDRDRLMTPARRRLALDLGLDPGAIAFMGAVHGTKTGVVDQPGLVQEVDAALTDRPGLALFAIYADCYPILLFDPARPALALVHAGWRGSRSGVATAAVERMRSAFGSRPEALLAGIGPGACGRCYQVGAEVAERFDREFLSAGRDGRFHLDLAGVNRAQLLAAGVAAENIELSGICTIEDDRLFSHRRDADGGRFACLAAIG